MSRLAKRPIAVPPKIDVTVSSGLIIVKGAKGTLQKPIHRLVTVAVSQDGVQVSTGVQSLESRALVGTYASHIRNMLQGVHTGFSKKLLIEGVGYKWDVQGKTLKLNAGFSHPITLAIPEGLTVTIEKNTLTVAGFDKELVGQFTANIRALRKPEPYKGKGIRYENEVIRRKQGKKAI